MLQANNEDDDLSCGPNDARNPEVERLIFH